MRAKRTLECSIRTMKFVIYLSILVMTICTPNLARTDQWATFVVPNCFALDDQFYKEHLSIRVFLSEAGGGQLYTHDFASGPVGIGALSAHPVSCIVNNRVIRFETLDYDPSPHKGPCGNCDQTGFRLTVDGKTIWQTPAPARRDYPLFSGTLDVDRDIARICTQYRPEDLGVVLRLPPAVVPDFPPPSILICRTYRY